MHTPERSSIFFPSIPKYFWVLQSNPESMSCIPGYPQVRINIPKCCKLFQTTHNHSFCSLLFANFSFLRRLLQSPPKRHPNGRLRPPNGTQNDHFWHPKTTLGANLKKNYKNDQNWRPLGPPKYHWNHKKLKKCVQKLILDTDAKKVPIWNPPDLQNYGFRARGASIFTISRDT